MWKMPCFIGRATLSPYGRCKVTARQIHLPRHCCRLTQLNVRLQGRVSLRWFWFKNKTDFTHSPIRPVPREGCAQAGCPVAGHQGAQPGPRTLDRAPHGTAGEKPHHTPGVFPGLQPGAGFGVFFGADAGLGFLSLFRNCLSMKSSTIPRLQFVLRLSLGAGSSWLGGPEMCFDLTPFFCRPFHPFCIQTSPLALCAHQSHHSHQTSLQQRTMKTCSPCFTVLTVTSIIQHSVTHFAWGHWILFWHKS